MTELSFLLDLLLNHKLPKATREAVTERVKDVEDSYIIASRRHEPTMPYVSPAPAIAMQAPSTQAILARNPDLVAAMPMPAVPEPQPVAVVGQTPAAIAALNSRQQAINNAIGGKTDKETGRPRKW